MNLEQLVSEFLADYGIWAVFLLLMLSGIGIALSEEMVIIPAGAFIAAGKMPFWEVLVASYLGVVLSDLLWFSICSHYGTPLLHRKWFKRMVHPRRLLETKHQFEERGLWVVIMARFIPSSRTTTITVAGFFHMPLWKFALATGSCVLVTVPLQTAAGYLIAKGLGEESVLALVTRLVGLFVLGVACMLVWRIWRRHRATKDRPPRAKAAWLRRFRRPRGTPAP